MEVVNNRKKYKLDSLLFYVTIVTKGENAT